MPNDHNKTEGAVDVSSNRLLARRIGIACDALRELTREEPLGDSMRRVIYGRDAQQVAQKALDDMNTLSGGTIPESEPLNSGDLIAAMFRDSAGA